MTSTQLDQLKKEYEVASQELQKYAEENSITDFYDGDIPYLELLLKKHEAYLAMKKAETPEYKFNTVHAPVMNSRIQRVKSRINTLSVGGHI